MLRRDRLLSASVLLALAIGCGSSAPTTPSNPGIDTRTTLTPIAESAEWPASTPAAERLDSIRLTDAVNRVRHGEFGRITSLLIARGDRLVVEEYFNGWTAAAAHTQQSVTKSVTSLAAGLAIDRGVLRLADTVTALFPDYEPITARDANKDALTVRDLLTMRTGFDWTEQNYQGSPLERLNTCFCDWIRFMLDWRMREPPGVTLRIRERRRHSARRRHRPRDWITSRRLADHLFAPLAFQEVRWERGLPNGLPHTGGGLYLRPRDMAKLGALVITGGRWQGRQVISQSWMRDSTQTSAEIVRPLAGRPATYGYLWWGLPGGVVTASGARGQWIFALPEQQLVVVSTAENSGGQEPAAVRLLYDYVLPAVQ